MYPIPESASPIPYPFGENRMICRYDTLSLTSCLTVLLLTGLVASPSIAVAQTWQDQIGLTDLIAEKGAALEDGSGVRVGLVEAQASPTNINYFPNSASSQFTGKVISDVSSGFGGATGTSSHATTVATRLFGNTGGVAPGVTDVSVYQASDFLNNYLGTGGSAPGTAAFDVTNHSYVSNGNTAGAIENASQRLDYVINRDNTFVAVGTNNGSGNSTPELLASSYNAVTVGLTNGGHARGETVAVDINGNSVNYGVGRIKPDIVAPEAATSFATPLVSGSAAILKEAGAGTNAAENETVKAILFAGATKEEFSGWDRTIDRPIDEVFGFGELNIRNSYNIFEGGEFEGVKTGVGSGTDIGTNGYDYDQFDGDSGADDLFYDFSVFADGGSLSAALNWNAEITDGNNSPFAFSPSFSGLANLDLALFDSSGTLVDQSISTDYNLEHIYQPDLAAGDYTLRISGDSATDFGLAWRIQAVPEPSSALFILGVGLMLVSKRRRDIP